MISEPSEQGRIEDVAVETGYSVPTIRRKSADPDDDFPAPRRLSPRAVRWDMQEVRTWIASRPRAVRNGGKAA